jgi:hypothetical protein
VSSQTWIGRSAHERRPADRDLLVAVIAISWDAGDLVAARAYATALVELAPNDEGIAPFENSRTPSATPPRCSMRRSRT